MILLKVNRNFQTRLNYGRAISYRISLVMMKIAGMINYLIERRDGGILGV
ncbi:MAG: hypothetical protein HY964_06710 [Ignavibacteriales bacterium]|nr:hypothetical protein [Ignavibacteriales bacterium]